MTWAIDRQLYTADSLAKYNSLDQGLGKSTFTLDLQQRPAQTE